MNVQEGGAVIATGDWFIDEAAHVAPTREPRNRHLASRNAKKCRITHDGHPGSHLPHSREHFRFEIERRESLAKFDEFRIHEVPGLHSASCLA
jgi:hypothetical protein